MASAHLLRLQIEAALSDRIPSALTPAPRVIRPTSPTGIAALDERLGGGLPIGAISELTGPECSGRSSLALSFVAGLTEAGRVCAWVDVSDALDPESAAAVGVDLERLLWVRCGREAEQLALPGMEKARGEREVAREARTETQVLRLRSPAATSAQDDNSFVASAKCGGVAQDDNAFLSGAKRGGLAQDNNAFSSVEKFAPRCAEPQTRVIRKNTEQVPAAQQLSQTPARRGRTAKPWSRLDQALRVTDLLLQGGGFSAIVLDMGSVAPEFALRVPLATWYRYRAAAERTQACVVLLTQRACAKSSAGVVLTLTAETALSEGGTVLTGAAYDVEIARERFAQTTAFGRKPPQSDHGVAWQSHSPWAGRR